MSDDFKAALEWANNEEKRLAIVGKEEKPVSIIYLSIGCVTILALVIVILVITASVSKDKKKKKIIKRGQVLKEMKKSQPAVNSPMRIL